MEPRTYSIEEAARASGQSRAVLEELIRSGDLRTLEREDEIRIPRSELHRCGLISDEAGGSNGSSAGEGMIADLTSRLERQAAELGGLRLLTVHAESLHEKETDALRTALHEAEAKLKEVELRAAEREEELRRANAGLVGELRVAQARIEELRARLDDVPAATRRRGLFARRN